MDNITIQNISTVSKVICTEWLTNHGLGVTGTVEELRVKIRKFLLYPKLVEKLRLKAKKHLYLPQVYIQMKYLQYQDNGVALKKHIL